MFKKLIASASAAAVALSSLSMGLVNGAPVVTDPELIDAVSWAYDAGLTKYSDADAFMSYNNLTREQFAKFASEFAYGQLDVTVDNSKECAFSDESSFDGTLAASIKMACQQGLMMGSNGIFMPKQLVTRGQVATVVSRMLGEIDPLSSEQAHFDYLKSVGIMNIANLNSAMTRGDALLVLYRIANGGDQDLCSIDPTLPGCTNNGTGSTNTGTVVKAGDLQISLNPSTPANMSSIPNNGVSRYAVVDFTAGSKDITLNTVTLMRSGLGSYTDFNGGRLYFESNGVRISSRGNVSSDDIVTLSFVPALTVMAGKTVSVDLMAELVSSAAGSENKFTSTVIDSSAANVNGKIDTPTLRTANYSVRSLNFTSLNATGSYQGNELTNELGKFQLQNIGTGTKDVNVKALTFRNVGNGDVAKSLTDLVLLRAGSKVSTSTIVNGRDVTFVLMDTIQDGQTATFTIQGSVNNVDNANGDTYKFILRQSSDLNAVESTTSFRTGVTIVTNGANDSTAQASYTVSGGELRFARDTSLALSQNVTRGSLAVELMKGTLTARQPILLENPTLAIQAGSTVVAEVAKRYYLQIGNSTFSWTPTTGDTTAQFDGSVTVNGTVPVRLYADVYSSAASSVNNVALQFGPLSYSSFTSNLGRIEYVSTQNAVNSSSAVGSISSSSVAVIDASLSVTKYDSLGTVVYTSNNAQGKVFYGIRLSNNQSNDIKVGSITLSGSNTAFNNGVSVNLKQGSTVLATRTFNGNTTFNGLNVIVKKDIPVDLTFEGDFLSTIASGSTGRFSVVFNAGDVVDNLTSNNVTVNGGAATSALVSVIGGGSIIATPNTVSTSQGFIVPGEEKKVGSVNIQAINDTLELRALYLKVIGSGAFATNAGNQIFNFKIKDSVGNVIATESARDTLTGYANDIVKFTSFSTNPQITAGSSKVFDIYATVNTVNDSASAGEFNIALATTYNDTSYTDEYLGTRLYSVNAGTYVNGSSTPTPVITTASLGNTLNVVASYPNVSKVADGNATDLITIRISNPGSTNLTVSGIQYFANAQSGNDIAKPAKIFNGSTVIASTTLVANANTVIVFNTPITVAGGDSVTLNVRLDSPFSNTATNPNAGNRVFQISNVNYAQTFANWSSSSFGFVPTGYTNTVGLPVAAANY